MKIICTQENLKTGLATVGRIISSSNTLPILNNVLIKTEKGLLKISSTNLEVAIITHIRCKVEEGGEVTVVAKTLSDLVNNLPNKNITLYAKSAQLEVEAENYYTSIKTLPAEEFPLIPTVESRSVLTLEAGELKESIDQVVFAAAINQTQPEITGVLFGMDEKGLRVAATDRYRLAEKKIAVKTGFSQDAIIPQKTVVELSRIIGGEGGQVEASFTETQVVFNFKDTQIISRLVDGQYPPYEQIIPASFKTVISVGKQPLVNALRAGGVFSQGVNSVKFEYNSDKQALVLTSESQDLGKSVVDIPCAIDGGSGTLVLNYHYILDCLLNMEDDSVKIKIIDDNSPSVIVPENKSNYIYLVMPIKS